MKYLESKKIYQPFLLAHELALGRQEYKIDNKKAKI
jgi:hypothetical protein